MAILVMTVTILNERPSLRDIRADLQARIKVLETSMERLQSQFLREREKAEMDHKRQVEALKRTLANYRDLLDLEDSFVEQRMVPSEKVGPAPQEARIPLPASKIPLADFFVEQLRARGSMSKDELRQAALEAGYFDDGETGGRTTHATLANILRSSRIAIVTTSEGIKYVVSKRQENSLL